MKYKLRAQPYHQTKSTKESLFSEALHARFLSSSNRQGEERFLERLDRCVPHSDSFNIFDFNRAVSTDILVDCTIQMLTCFENSGSFSTIAFF